MRRRGATGTPLALRADAALDGLLVVLAVWTVAYHVALVLRIGSSWTLLATAVVLAAIGVATVRRHRHRHRARSSSDGPPEPQGDRPADHPGHRWAAAWPWVAGGLAAVAAVAMALRLPWTLVVVGWCGAALAGLVAAWPAAAARHHVGPAPAAARPGRWDAPVVLAWAVGLAVLSMWTLRANPDDLYYVNLSQWVAAHGTFPLRDTLFADLRWPMTSWPPVGSYDTLTGAIAHPLGLRAGTLVYEVVPPLMTVAAVLALWRLLRTWRTPHVAWAISLALLFLLLDGTRSYATPGNLFVTRLWQGKVILLCVVVPLALVHALRYVERPSRRRLVRLAVTGTAAVGCSTTAMFLVPVLAVAGAAPLVLRRPRAALAGFAALAGYPLAAGVVTVALNGRSADDFDTRRLYRFDPEWIGHAVFLTDAVAVVGVLAVLLGPLTVPHRAGRLTTAVLVAVVGATFVPGATQVAFDVSGLGPTLWRLSWALTIGALVGVGGVAAWCAVRRRVRGRRPRRVAALVTTAGLAAYALTAPSSLASDTYTSFDAPLHWQRTDATRDVVSWLMEAVPAGSVILAPTGVSITLTVTTTAIKPVAPRGYFMDRLADQPGFDYDARLLLVRLANPTDRPAGWTRPDLPAVQEALDRLDVAAVCLYATAGAAARLVQRAGYEPAYATPTYRCLLPDGMA